MIAMALACGPDLDEVGGGSGDGSGSSSGSTTNTTMPTTNTTMPTTTQSTADGTSGTGPLDTGPSSATGTGGPDATTDEPATSTSGTTAGTSEGSSSGEPPGESYPGCMDDADCPEPYALCWPPIDFGTPNFCTLECGNAGECPVATSGTATPVCEGPPGTDICVLDCSMGECPDGMTCVDIFGNGDFLRCTRQ